MRAYPMEEEVEERGVVDGLDLRPGPVVPRPVPYRALRLRGGQRGDRAQAASRAGGQAGKASWVAWRGYRRNGIRRVVGLQLTPSCLGCHCH
jgi:hypothetical protein